MHDDDLMIVIDSTGIKRTNRAQWMDGWMDKKGRDSIGEEGLPQDPYCCRYENHGSLL